jgi:hypothetical protein
MTKTNKVDVIAAEFEKLGRIAGSGDVARIDACKLYATLLNTGKLGLPAKAHAAFKVANTAESEKRARSFLESRAQVTGEGKVNDATVKTYGAHYRTFANASERLPEIVSAVSAFAKGKSKSDMHNKGVFDVMYNLASKVSKGTLESGTKITPSYIAKAITPKASATTDGGKPKTADVIAREAFADGVKAMLKDAGLDDKAKAKLTGIAKALGVTV